MKYKVKIKETSRNTFRVSLIRVWMMVIPFGYELLIGEVSSTSIIFDDKLHALVSEAKDKAITVNSVDTRILVQSSTLVPILMSRTQTRELWTLDFYINKDGKKFFNRTGFDSFHGLLRELWFCNVWPGPEINLSIEVIRIIKW